MANVLCMFQPWILAQLRTTQYRMRSLLFETSTALWRFPKVTYSVFTV